MNKIYDTLSFIETGIKDKKPVLLCSFGKDSMTLLHLIRQVMPDIPVIFWQTNSQKKRYGFAHQIMRDWNLTVYDYPPAMTDIIYKDGRMNGVAAYWLGKGVMCKVLWLQEADGNYACAVEDILGRPTCSDYTFNWDCVISGHKKIDVDLLLGKLELKENKRNIDGLDMLYPLFSWTNDDIWAYIRDNNIPYNRGKYDDNGNVFMDTTFNENYHSACFKCLNPLEKEAVYCEKEKKEVQNAGKLINFEEKLRGYSSVMKKYMEMEI